MKPNERLSLEETIQFGVDYGYMRAHKHVDHPSEDQLKQALIDALEAAFDERWDIDQDCE